MEKGKVFGVEGTIWSNEERKYLVARKFIQSFSIINFLASPIVTLRRGAFYFDFSVKSSHLGDPVSHL